MSTQQIAKVTHVELSPLLLGAKDAAKLLGISERTLWTLTEKGELPVVKVFNRTLWPSEDLRRWVEAHKEYRAASTAARD